MGVPLWWLIEFTPRSCVSSCTRRARDDPTTAPALLELHAEHRRIWHATLGSPPGRAGRRDAQRVRPLPLCLNRSYSGSFSGWSRERGAELLAGAEVELAVDAAKVLLNGLDGDEERLGDLLVAQL